MIDSRMETFLQLCETMNYTRTAELLNMTQPAVTQQIHYLEKQYDCKLFEYRGRTLTKTPKGQKLEQYARTMRYNDRIIFEHMRAKEEDIPLIRVGATKTIGEYVIGERVVRYLREPKRNLSLTVENTNQLLAKLEHGEIDLAFIEGLFDKNSYEYQMLDETSFVGICGSSHRFAGKEISLQEIFSETFIVREQGSGTRDVFEQRIHEHSYTLENFKRVTEVNDFSVITQLVKENIGISFVYEPVYEREKGMGLERFTIAGMPMKYEFNAVYLKDSLIAGGFLEEFVRVNGYG